ncbi:MAG: DMT family transporter [Bacteroidales bacterium]|nr:DMT family transporter [Bacteroidales bacterium]
MKKPTIPVYFYAVAAMLFWGMSFVWSSILLKYYQPITIIFIRLLISSIFLFCIIILFGKFQKIRRRDYKWFLLNALFNPFLYFLGENYGLKYSTSTIAAVIIATIPVFSPLAGYLAYREKLRLFNFIGIGLSFGGITIMLLSKGMQLQVSFLGVLFLGGAVVSALLYTIMLKKLSATYSPLNIIGIQNFIGIFLFLPLFLIFEFPQALSITPNREIISSFLMLAILASSLSFVFFAHTVKILGIIKANIFSNLIPVFAALFSFWILDESFTMQKIIGIVIVILGVYITEINRKKRLPRS